MLDVPLDAVYYWLGLSVVSLAVVGVATNLPTQPPPDATAAANTVDALAASAYDGTAEQPLAASEIRLTPYAIGLRTDAGATHATFAFGPVTPAPPGSSLAAVARGTPPDQVFEDPSAFAAAAARARTNATDVSPRADGSGTVANPDTVARAQSSTPGAFGRWRPAPDELIVRQLNWGDVRVTLVLA